MSSRFRDDISQPLTMDYFHQRLSQGWVLKAIEWAKPFEQDDAAPSRDQEEVPYGQRVSEDCGHLVEHPREMEVISFIYDGLIAGERPPQIAAALNERSYRTRRGLLWTAPAVYELMPRIIELSPRLQRRPDWPGHRAQLKVIA
jgi:hypothetical protein